MFFTIEEKHAISERISNSSKKDQLHIFFILKSNMENFTYNKNGVFFDLIETSNKSLEQIKNYLDTQNL